MARATSSRQCRDATVFPQTLVVAAFAPHPPGTPLGDALTPDGAAPRRCALRSRPRGCKLADLLTVFVLLLIVVIAFAMGFESQFNGPFAITAIVLLFLGAIADIARR